MKSQKEPDISACILEFHRTKNSGNVFVPNHQCPFASEETVLNPAICSKLPKSPRGSFRVLKGRERSPVLSVLAVHKGRACASQDEVLLIWTECSFGDLWKETTGLGPQLLEAHPEATTQLRDLPLSPQSRGEGHTCPCSWLTHPHFQLPLMPILRAKVPPPPAQLIFVPAIDPFLFVVSHHVPASRFCVDSFPRHRVWLPPRLDFQVPRTTLFRQEGSIWLKKE